MRRRETNLAEGSGRSDCARNDGVTEHRLVITPAWRFLTSHGLTLLYVALDPDATIRQMAEDLQLTERRVCDVLRDLCASGFVEVIRCGRRNSYRVNRSRPFIDPTLSDIAIGDFIDLVSKIRNLDKKPRRPSCCPSIC